MSKVTVSDTNNSDENLTNKKELSENEVHADLKLGIFEIWCLGIAVVIGGQYFSWNFGLAAGFGTSFITVALIGIGYILLCSCNAEITSAHPFAGGAYGLARMTFGFYPGYIIGCCEAVEYLIYVSTSSISLSNMIIHNSNASMQIQPVLCLIFYISALWINIMGGFTLWRTIIFLGVISIMILLLYCLGSLPFVDISTYTATSAVTGIDDALTENQWFIGGMSGFMKVLPLACWFYVGVESLNFCASIVHKVTNVL